MSASVPSRPVCRVVIGLKAASEIDASVDAATTLALAVEAELVGLFVEEDAMLDLAGLPFAQAVDFGIAQPRRLSPQVMIEAFSRHSAMCRRSLSAYADQAHVKWSFTIERGELRGRIEAASATGDYLVLPGEGRGFGTYQLVEELRATPSHARGVVIVRRRPPVARKGPVVAIDDGDAAGGQTVALAARIAEVTGCELQLFAIAGSSDDAGRIARRAQRAAGRRVQVSVQRFPPGAPRSIAAALVHVVPSFVVADLNGEPFRDDESAHALLRAAQAPVLLLRVDEQSADNER